MYFHGINLEYVVDQFPFLNPEGHISSKRMSQIKDREHLVETFGLEPVHLLESSKDYSFVKCLRECFSFGDVVFVFRGLREPLWQISSHEIGVRLLDLRECHYIVVKCAEKKKRLKKLLPGKPIILAVLPDGVNYAQNNGM